jgi:hypothetical protein
VDIYINDIAAENDSYTLSTFNPIVGTLFNFPSVNTFTVEDSSYTSVCVIPAKGILFQHVLPFESIQMIAFLMKRPVWKELN